MAKWVVGDGGTATPKYGKLSEKIRHTMAGSYQCKLFCGGANCKYESSFRWRKEDMAIDGIFSHWVTDQILAMARPNTILMSKYNLIQKFQVHGIKSIVNLQEVNEHASCGPPLHRSGFSYDPQQFMDADIFFYNFGWRDYGVPTMNCVFDMVKVVDFALQEGKVAVHCHAGLGRTGVVIACYLVYAYRMAPDDAILHVRSKRPNACQTRGQMEIVRLFAEHIRPMRVVFPTSTRMSDRFTLAQYLKRQRAILHGMEARDYRRIPKVVKVLCKELIKLSKRERKQKLSDWTGVTVGTDVSNLSSRSTSSASLGSNLGKVLPPIDLSGAGNDLSCISSSENSPTSERHSQCLPQSKGYYKTLSYSALPEEVDLAHVQTSRPEVVGCTVDDLAVRDSYKSEMSRHKRRFSAAPFPAYGRTTLEVHNSLTMSPTHYHVTNDFLLSEATEAESCQLSSVGTSSLLPSMDTCGLEEKDSRMREISFNYQVNDETVDDNVFDATKEVADGKSLYMTVTEALLLRNVDKGVLKKAEELMQKVNTSTNWNCVYCEQDPRVLALMLKTWLGLLSEPLISTETVDKVEMLLADGDISCKKLLCALSKPQELLMHSLCELLAKIVDTPAVELNKLVKVFAKLLLTVEKDTEVSDELVEDLEGRQGAVKSFFTKASRFLRRESSLLREPDIQVDTKQDTRSSSVDVMVRFLTKVVDEKLDIPSVACEVKCVVTPSPRLPSDRPHSVSKLLKQSASASCLTTLNTESESASIKRVASWSSLGGKKPLPPIGETSSCVGTDQD